MILRTLLLLAVTCASALRVQPLVHGAPRAAATEVRMMGNNAPEGPFTPLVLAGKVVLGEKTFNKVRGKLISYHSGYITEFCTEFGVTRQMRAALIKKAKITGGDLGFLN